MVSASMPPSHPCLDRKGAAPETEESPKGCATRQLTCPLCKAKQEVHVTGKPNSFSQMGGPQVVACVKCNKGFETSIPDTIIDGPFPVVLQMGDTVEEISSKRQGTIDNMSINHGADGTQTVNYWRVRFADGKGEPFVIFKDETELRLIPRPNDATGGPGFFLARGIMD